MIYKLSMLLINLFIIILSFPHNTSSSEGNKDKNYLRCKRECVRQKPPLTRIDYLTLRWTNFQKCNYECMFKRINETGKIEKYYGKWPFKAYFGLQEPASAIFSMMNFMVHLFYYRKQLNLQPALTDSKNSRAYTKRICKYIILNMNAWLMSSIFHSRKTRLTERLDYFSAFLAIMFGVYVALLRTFERLNYKRNLLRLRGLLGFTCVLHILKMLHKFDYSYNMTISITLFVMQNVAWVVFSFRNRSLQYCSLPLKFCILISIAGLFEVYDFPPIRFIFDSHSIWHFGSIFAFPIMHRFFVKDLITYSELYFNIRKTT